jgi:flagellar biosynthesis anti-sigma factor FlgM
MRIESGYPIQGTDEVERSKKKSPQSMPAPNEGATTELSADSIRLSSLETRANATADVRSERVAALKQSIDEGTYTVSDSAIADAMLKDVLRR